MSSSKSCLPLIEEAQLVIPPGSRPSDRFLPIRINTEELREAEIYRGDIIYANLSLMPSEGQFTAIQTLQRVLLGFLFATLTEYLRVECACRCLSCGPLFIHPASILSIGPVTNTLRRNGHATMVFSYRKFRGALWDR
jgi:hypothetical protein